MQNEEYIKNFVNTGSLSILLNWLKYLKDNEYYFLGVFICELVYSIYCYDINFLDNLGIFYYYSGHYQQSWEVYMDILSSSHLSEERQKALFFNAHFSISYIKDMYLDYPHLKIKQICYNTQPIPLITFSITTCKRYDLFEKTMNSFINCCEDIDLITHWICIDDNSSPEDRLKMKENYPFFNFYWKTLEEKGHAQSMNLILDMVKTPYLFHMEDDWQFFHLNSYIKQCLEILDSSPEIGQCLINKNYSETFEDIRIVGGLFNKTKFGLRYYIHEYYSDSKQFIEKYGDCLNCSYWPHYSLRPGMNKVYILKDIGKYNPQASHFEMEYSYRYVEKGYKTAFLDTISCTHIGRLTKEIGDDTKINAYKLNNESQFIPKTSLLEKTQEETNKVQFIVINLDHRKDRLETLKRECEKRKQQDGTFIKFTRFPAINGYNLKSTRQMEQLYNFNDYNFRKGMIGCSLSHLSLWVQLIKTKEAYVILEDDVTFVPYFVLKLTYILESIKNLDWDIVFLGHHVYDKYKNDEIYNKYKLPTCEQWSTLKSLTESLGGTGGYLINYKGAYKMLNFIQQKGMIHGIDTMMQKACDELNIYYCTPHLIYSDCYTKQNIEIDTDIQTNYDSLKRSKEDRLNDELQFFKDNNIPYQLCNNKHNLDVVTLCDNNCEESDIIYSIETINIHIPKHVVTQHKCLQDIGLMSNNEFSIKHLINAN